MVTAPPLQEHHQTFIEVLGSIPICLLNEKVTPTAVDTEKAHICQRKIRGGGSSYPFSPFHPIVRAASEASDERPPSD